MLDYLRIKREMFPGTDFYPVVKLPDTTHVLDFTKGYHSEDISDKRWGIGRYNEKRPNMYVAPQYENRRNIHMGVDIWSPPDAPVYAAWRGEVAYQADHAERGNYGPTIVLKHQIGDHLLFALYGHLSRGSLERYSRGDLLSAGDIVGRIGCYEENGNWEPHLHYQLSWKDPGEADMPGVVSEEDHREALEIYPDPRIILGPVY